MSNENGEKTKKFKITAGLVIKCIALAILLVYIVFMAFGASIFGTDNYFYKGLNFFMKDIAEFSLASRIVSYFIFCIGVSWVLRFILRSLAKPLKKGKAIVDIVCSLIKYSAMIVLIFFVLKDCGVDTNAILAGIGILGLIIGLGAQPLIADIIAGLFIVFENVFDVGDIIVADNFRGTVKEIGIRTTKIEDIGGNIKIMNNADLKSIINMTNQLSLAICEVSIEYGESLERVEAILKDNMASIKEAIPDIVEGPFYKGVQALGDSGVLLRFVANCHEDIKYQVERDMNRQFRLLFDKNNINIPFPQVVVNKPITFADATKKQQEDAHKFVQEQKEAAKSIPDGGDVNV